MTTNTCRPDPKVADNDRTKLDPNVADADCKKPDPDVEWDAEKDEAFLQKVRELKELCASAERKQVSVQYPIALACLDIVQGENNQYGHYAVHYAAEQLRISDVWFRKVAKVAEAWTQEQIEVLAARENSRRWPLSWTHFVELADVEDDGIRSRLTEEALDKSWSVRTLTKHIKKETGQSTEKGKKKGAKGQTSEGDSADQGEAAADDGAKAPEPWSPWDFGPEDILSHLQVDPVDSIEVAKDQDEELLERLEGFAPDKFTDPQVSALRKALGHAKAKAAIWELRRDHLLGVYGDVKSSRTSDEAVKAVEDFTKVGSP